MAEDLIHEKSFFGDEAIFSLDGRYRYLLTRNVSSAGSTLGVIMLNPSTADAREDDPTIRRLRKFAASWGHAKLLIGNLFALRSPHPDDLQRELDRGGDPVGVMNDHWIGWIFERSNAVLYAWGCNALAETRLHRLGWLAEEHGVEALCLGQTKDGHPIHPMARGKHRVSDDTQPRAWP